MINNNCNNNNNNATQPKPWRVACGIVGILTSLLLFNWGLGIVSVGGWMAIRFVTAFVSAGVMNWAKQVSLLGGRHYGENYDFGEKQLKIMEEGRANINCSFSDFPSEGNEPKTTSPTISSQQQLLEKKWLDAYWLAGVASSAFVGGWIFYPLNRLMLAFHPHERLYAFLFVVGLGGLVDRCLCRYFSKQQHSIHSVGQSSSSDEEMLDGHNHRMSNHERSSSLQRRKQVHSKPHIEVTFEEEQQPALFQDGQIQRKNSFDSEQFFDCLDDIELATESDDKDEELGTMPKNQTPTNIQSYENLISIYSKRRVSYPDGTPAYVPAGESQSTTPPGYLALHKNNIPRARREYELTQQWRRQHQIDSIHSRPHTWFPKIKDAYSHVIHGFTLDGMPVVYESPGKMNLKSLFRNGCSVDDMVFHYCYLMEYMSNLEGILTELHANNDDDVNDDDGESWQEELAAYAHAKQKRLQDDPVAYGFCVVMDIRGVGLGILSGDVMAYLKRSGDTNTAHYPGSMRRAIAINAPYLVGVAWKTIKGVMPESVTVDLWSEAQTTEAGGGLTQYIDEDQIPVEYGGKSKYKLGEHPFEVGLKTLVKRQGDDIDSKIPTAAAVSFDSPSVNNSTTPLYFPPNPPPKEMDVKLEHNNSTSSTANSSTTHEWDGLGTQAVLTVVAFLQFFVFVVIGSLEMALPYWMISSPTHGGLGCGSRMNGMAVLVSCLIIAWTIKRSRFFRLARSTIEESPLRGFRIGVGTTCFVLACVGLIPLTLDPNRSTLGLFCFSVHLSLLFFGCALGILSLGHLRSVVITPLVEGSNASFPIEPGWVQSPKSISAVSTVGRIVGYLFIPPIFRWSIQTDLFFPFNASFFLCLLACLCWMLYIVSFSLHAAAPSPPIRRTEKMESQFMSAMLGLYSFIKEVLLVAFVDVNFLANALSRRGSSR